MNNLCLKLFKGDKFYDVAAVTSGVRGEFNPPVWCANLPTEIFLLRVDPSRWIVFEQFLTGGKCTFFFRDNKYLIDLQTSFRGIESY